MMSQYFVTELHIPLGCCEYNPVHLEAANVSIRPIHTVKRTNYRDRGHFVRDVIHYRALDG